MKSAMRVFFLVVAVAAASSCRVAPDIHRDVPVSGALAEESRNSAELAYDMSTDTWCSNDEACSMVLLMISGEDRCLSFEQRRDILAGKGLLDPRWMIGGDEPVTKGTLSYMVCGALGLRGGVLMQVLPSRRYAYREALYHKLLSRGSEYEPLTGPEVVGIVGRAGRMMDERSN